jgi:hypothetical protein
MARVLIVGDVPGLEAQLASDGYAVSVVADPDPLGRVLPHLHGVSVICWLAGPELLPSLLTKLVDTHVRGLVHRGAEEAVRAATEAFPIRTAAVEDAGEARAAVGRVLAAGGVDERTE